MSLKSTMPRKKSCQQSGTLLPEQTLDLLRSKSPPNWRAQSSRFHRILWSLMFYRLSDFPLYNVSPKAQKRFRPNKLSGCSFSRHPRPLIGPPISNSDIFEDEHPLQLSPTCSGVKWGSGWPTSQPLGIIWFLLVCKSLYFIKCFPCLILHHPIGPRHCSLRDDKPDYHGLHPMRSTREVVPHSSFYSSTHH